MVFHAQLPAGQPVYWIGRTISLARSNGISIGLITSPGGALMRCLSCWSAAAKDGAFMVAIQSQGWGWDKTTKSWDLSTWDSQVAAAVATVRQARGEAGTNTLVMIGLGTNNPTGAPGVGAGEAVPLRPVAQRRQLLAERKQLGKPEPLHCV
jgi:hypothetical protein